MRGFVYFALMCWSAVGWGQASLVTFEKVYGGSGYDDFADIIQLKDTGYLVLGSTGNFGANSSDVMLFKINKHGIIQWKKILGYNGIEKAIKLVELNDSYAILAQSNSNATGDYDILFYNLDTLGNIRHSEFIGTPSWDAPDAMILNEIDSTLLITVNSDNESTGIANPSIFQINLDGTIIQSKQFSSNYYWRLNGLIKGNGNKYYSAATTQKNDILGNVGLATINVFQNNITVDLIEYFDSSKQEGRCIEYFDDGNISIGEIHNVDDTLHVIHIIKCDTLGSKFWEYDRFVSYCVSTESDIYDIIPIENNRIVFAGYLESFQSPQNCSPPYNFGGGQKDGFFETIGGDSYYIEGGNFGDVGNERILRIIKTLDGGIILGGITNSNGNGLNDIYIIKTNIHGSTLGAINTTETTLDVKNINNSKLSISIFNDDQTLYFKGIESNFHYRVFNINSAEVMSGFIYESMPKINVNNLSKGCYLIELTNGIQRDCYKFISR
jgi:hypothetical protein